MFSFLAKECSEGTVDIVKILKIKSLQGLRENATNIEEFLAPAHL